VIAVASESKSTEHRLLFRIGINVGNVMGKDGDIFGDCVNIAARLETLADSRGICVSRGVRDHVRRIKRCAARTISRVASCGDVELGRTARGDASPVSQATGPPPA
jgi:class 3 adenylate cyclase